MALTQFIGALNATMRGVVWQGIPYNISVVDLPRPSIITNTDAIVHVSSSAICGSDLHTYRGASLGPAVPRGMGHEAIGYVSEIGDGVHHVSTGDPVVIPFTVAEGHIHTGLTEELYGGYGHTAGGEGGMQAEYVRVPNADYSLIPVPEFTASNSSTNTTESLEMDLLLLSDIFATGWTAIDFSGFHPGDTVAVFGAGPVGLLAAYSAILKGASKVYSVDYIPSRLSLAESIGAIPINLEESDPVDQILAFEPDGVIRSVDCVGYEAVDRNLTRSSDIVTHNMLAVTATVGGLGTVGVYNPPAANSSNAPLAGTIPADVGFPIGSFFNRELTWHGGISRPIELAPALLQLITSGKARPSFVISQQIQIEDVPEAYARFERHEEVKIVIRFN